MMSEGGKRGRPVKCNERREHGYRVMLNDSEVQKLDELSDKLGVSKADALRIALDKYHLLSQYNVHNKV